MTDDLRSEETGATLTDLSSRDHRQLLRMVEALLFASREPLSASAIANRLPDGADVPALLNDLKAAFAGRGVNLVQVGDKWRFRTAEDLRFLLSHESVEERKLSRAALETLAIIAYHQPVTRADVEEIRGVSVGKGSMDLLMEAGWIRMRGRRKSPGRPITYGTTEEFLDHFALSSIKDLPGLEELKGAGLLEGHVPAGFTIPSPTDADALGDDEDPLDLEDADDLLTDLDNDPSA